MTAALVVCAAFVAGALVSAWLADTGRAEIVSRYRMNTRAEYERARAWAALVERHRPDAELVFYQAQGTRQPHTRTKGSGI